ncbi:glycosyltransferase family 39 protein [Polynucleobacter sp. IMCC 30228]|uniref:glycosyltransferase family 39 protein n=1 Tax=Polynucleobacter sp. IMCC 30228 TaxID=2781011 RepID=UPI001F3DC093|nr:glycosyltransferase family 39 protein [Polynucleobacter sp. IMCC 30228]
MLYLIILFNALRFSGLEISPPGFYADESYGATQVMCVRQTGADFFGHFLPLFAISGPGEPIYTPTYLYGQLLWTSIFGYSITSFRAFPAFITTLTILFLYLFVKNKINYRTAMYVAFVASIMPWAFQFSRIAWDPPLAPLFLIMALWISTWQKRWWLTGIPIALAIYSYPPLRIIAPLIWLLIPGITWRRKIVVLLIAGFFCIPLLFQFQDENFANRSNMLALWSPAFYNPYRHLDLSELIPIFLRNFSAHFSFRFLFISGENNLRHSIQSFGMLSWLDFLALIGILGLIGARVLRRIPNIFEDVQYQILGIALIGVVVGIIPAALTNEGSPHALRAISVWPFYALMTGIILSRINDILRSKKIALSFIALGVIFFGLYQYFYFYKYPYFSQEAFEAGFSNNILYPKLLSGESSCDEVRAKVKIMDRNTRIGETIFFAKDSKGPITSYLNKHWHDREAWGIWSDGKNADLLIPLPNRNPRKIKIQFNAFLTPQHPYQDLEILINGRLLQKIRIDRATGNAISLNLPDDLNPDKLLNIEFRTPNAVSPTQAGVSSSDQRILGFGLVSVQFD